MKQESEKLIELKLTADRMGISYNPNIGEAKLQEKINTFLEEEKEEISKQVEVKGVTENVELSEASKERNHIAEAEARARETLVVRVLDNDNRVNNRSTTFTVRSTNLYFDLGQLYGPLNKEIEILRGHYETLKEIKFTQHIVEEGKTITQKRNRYNVEVIKENVATSQ